MDFFRDDKATIDTNYAMPWIHVVQIFLAPMVHIVI